MLTCGRPMWQIFYRNKSLFIETNRLKNIWKPNEKHLTGSVFGEYCSLWFHYIILSIEM